MDLNQGPLEWKSSALPTEPRELDDNLSKKFSSKLLLQLIIHSKSEDAFLMYMQLKCDRIFSATY